MNIYTFVIALICVTSFAVAKLRITKRQLVDEVGGVGAEITPIKSALVGQVKKLRRRVQEIQDQADHLKELKKVENVVQLLKPHTTPALMLLLRGEIKNKKRDLQGRRWDIEDKLFALALFKRSPRQYRFLCCLLVIPSIRTLQRVLHALPLQPGLNEALIKHLGENLKKEDRMDPCCILMFDEIFIRKRLFYNEHLGYIEGYCDFGTRKKENGESYQDRRGLPADHALVFQVQGLARRYKQPIGYHFVSGTVSSKDLANLVPEYITQLQANGFNVMATVCDQGPTNRKALTKLMSETDNGAGLTNKYFKVGEAVIYPLFDVPHLFKNLRSNFMRSVKVVWDNTIASYRSIRRVWRYDRGLFRMKYLTERDINPRGKGLMKVQTAARVLSRNVSKALITSYNNSVRSRGRLGRDGWGNWNRPCSEAV